jgi:protoporphyrinogen oxidase
LWFLIYVTGVMKAYVQEEILPRKVAIVGGGVAGLGAAWALNKHPDRFDIRLFEANATLGGNAITVRASRRYTTTTYSFCENTISTSSTRNSATA